MQGKCVLMLAQEGDLTTITYNAISRDFCIDKIVLESPEPRVKFLRRRAKRMGYRKVLGQILFVLLLVPLLRYRSRTRVAEIKREFGLEDRPIEPANIVRVNSVNSKRCRELVAGIAPDVVLVVGTRILSPKLLSAIPVPFINIHCGITPLYRGAHGAYWALAQRDTGACGVTVHLIDPGIDTGAILEQGLIQTTQEDNYYTYPYLQFGVGVALIKKALGDALVGRLVTKPNPPGESRLWTHPTIGEYIANRIRSGVR